VVLLLFDFVTQLVDILKGAEDGLEEVKAWAKTYGAPAVVHRKGAIASAMGEEEEEVGRSRSPA
jgi:hypothetical protein